MPVSGGIGEIMPFFQLTTACIAPIPPFMGFAVFTAISCIALWRGSNNRTNRLFAGICFLGALINIDVALVSFISDKTVALRIDRLVYLFFLFSVPLYIWFIHSYLGITGRRWLEVCAFLSSLVFLPFSQTNYFISGFNHYSFGRIAQAGPLYTAFMGVGGLTSLYCLVTLFRSIRRARDNQQRNRIKYIFAGLGLSALLILMNAFPISGFNFYPIGNFSFIPAIILAFGVLKYDLLDIGTVIWQGTIYFFLTAILTIIYVLVIYLFNLCFIEFGNANSLMLPLILAAVIVLLFNPLKNKVQQLVDNLFFRGKYNYEETLREISGVMTSLLRLEHIAEYVQTSVLSALNVTTVALHVFDDEEQGINPNRSPGMCWHKAEGAMIDLKEAVSLYVASQTGILTRESIAKSSISEALRERILSFMQVTAAVLIIPVIFRKKLAGIISLGEKKSGELFVYQDIELLVTVSNQTAIAIENAASYEKLEEMNFLLERKVEERTKKLQRVLEEKEKTQQHLIQSESLAAIGQLVAGTAHELNNPLAGASSLIQTTLETIRDCHDSDKERQEMIDDLQFSLHELERAGNIVKSLLGLSRQTQIYVEPVIINIVIDDALRVLHNQYKRMDVTIMRDYDDTLPEIEGNFANLGQVFINVIKNALQALPEKNGKITLKTEYIEDSESIRIECRDNGRGIHQQSVREIFKPFYTTKRVGEGTGLGLYIAHEIIKRHGGTIGMESSEGEGASLTILLPIKRRMK